MHPVQIDTTVTRRDGRAVVVVRGEIDMKTAATFRAALDVAASDSSMVEVDLGGTTFMDSSGLAVLVELFQRLGRAQESLVLRDPSPAITRLLEVSGLDALMDLRHTDGHGAAPGPGALQQQG